MGRTCTQSLPKDWKSQFASDSWESCEIPACYIIYSLKFSRAIKSADKNLTVFKDEYISLWLVCTSEAAGCNFALFLRTFSSVLVICFQYLEDKNRVGYNYAFCSPEKLPQMCSFIYELPESMKSYWNSHQ